MSINEVSIAMVDGTPTFTAVVGEGGLKRIITKPYIGHKTLTDAISGNVVSHCFLVQDTDYAPSDVEGVDLGATYTVWYFPVKYTPGQKLGYHFGDVECLNNYDFAYAYFVKAYGNVCFHPLHSKFWENAEAKITMTDSF